MWACGSIFGCTFCSILNSRFADLSFASYRYNCYYRTVCACVFVYVQNWHFTILRIGFAYSLLHCTLHACVFGYADTDVRCCSGSGSWLRLIARTRAGGALPLPLPNSPFAFTVALPVRCVALLKHECSCSGAAALCALGSKSSALLRSFFALAALSGCVCVLSWRAIACSLCVHRCCCCCYCCRCCCFHCWFTLAPAPPLLLLLPSQLRAAPSEFAC